MAKDKLTEYSATNASNDVIGDISVSEGMLPSAVNNALREQMTHLKNFADGTDAINALAVDNLKLDGNTISSTDTNGDITIDPDGTGDTIIASGNLGVGTSSPSTLMHLSASSPRITLTDTDTGADHRINADSGAGNLAFDVDVNSDTASPSAVFNMKGSERLRITSAGNVGIGTSSPSDALTVSTSAVNGGVTVSGSTDPQYFLNSSGGNQARFKISDASAMIQTGSWTNIPVGFYVNGTEAVRITTGGNVHLNNTGLTSFHGSSRLQIQSASQAISAVTSGGGGVSPIAAWQQAASGFLAYWTVSGSNTNVGNISTNGSSTSYNTTSDYRLKENVTYDWDATTRLKQLKPARFSFIADPNTVVDGFLAHEAETVVPECVTGTKDAMRDEGYEVTPAVLDDDGNVVTEAVMGTHSVPDYQGIDQSKLVPLLVKTIQELEARITALESN